METMAAVSCSYRVQAASCRPVHRTKLRRVVARCDPHHNPQNVDNPLVRLMLQSQATEAFSGSAAYAAGHAAQLQFMPTTTFSPVDAVRVQMDACARNDEPWTNHGIQTMYEFAEEAGDMERSRYFVTLEKDLYHFDHFLGGFNTMLGALVDNEGYTILEPSAGREVAPGVIQVDVQVTDSRGEDAGVFTFTMVQKQLGRKKGCWMTKSVGLAAAHAKVGSSNGNGKTAHS